jgi:AraC-like DNA-binding protein
MSQTLSIKSTMDQDCGPQTPALVVHPRFAPNESTLEADLTQVRHQEIPDYQSATARRIAPTLDYMMAHLDQPVTIATLSAMVELSQSSFFELFRQATQVTPLQWFIRARMDRACELLTQTQMPIKQIARQVGYEDPLYFSRAFKSVCGIPPTEYRARIERNTANPVAA